MFLLFDIGGTKMRIARSKDGALFDRYSIIPTPADFDEGMRSFREVGEGLLEGAKVSAVAGGIAGPLLKDKSGLANARSLAGWAHKPFARTVREMFGARVFLENDTAVVGLGEAHYGAGKGAEVMVYITISTGVGGVRIVNGSIDANRFGFEPGHQTIQFAALPGSLGFSGHEGHWEDFVSGRALERRYGMPAQEIRDARIWEESARVAAIGLANTLLHWSPDVVVLGGSMIAGKPGIPLDSVRAHLRERLSFVEVLPKVKKAALGDVGGFYGAIALLKSRAGK